MKKGASTEFAFQAISLVLAVILVHGVYVTLVRPRADTILAEQAALMEADANYVQQRSVWVIIRDFEQEACFILMLWGLAIMSYKWATTARENRLLQTELIPIADGMRILPEDAREYTAHAVCEGEAERLDSELSMVRYLAWAIPSIGFIGTVRGIGDALGLAHKAVEGEIAGVTRSLGVAFNSTFIALLLSIVLMFVLHQLQLQQERLVLDTETYLDRHLVRHLQVASSAIPASRSPVEP
jgi:phage shock protein PspC (stress-responsive transcriptional regulator)